MDLSSGKNLTSHQRELLDRIYNKGDYADLPWSSHFNNVEFLLAQRDFDINFTYYGQSPLFIACTRGVLECVQQVSADRRVALRARYTVRGVTARAAR